MTAVAQNLRMEKTKALTSDSSQLHTFEASRLAGASKPETAAHPPLAEMMASRHTQFETNARSCYTTPEFLAKSFALIDEEERYQQINTDSGD